MSEVIAYDENNYSVFEWFEGVAVIRFYPDWCQPCGQNFPVFAELATHYAEVKADIKFGKINIDQSPILTYCRGEKLNQDESNSGLSSQRF